MSDRPSEIEAVFLAALEKSTPDERTAYLDEVCAADPELRSQVESFLRSHEEAGSFLEHPPAGLAATAATRDASDIPSSLCGAAESALDFLEPCDKPDRLGRLGQYEIMELVGRGGMGIVLKGHDPKLNRVVAIKVLAPELAAIATARQRFLREAQAAAAVSHDHVVTIHAIDDGARLPFLVMEYVAGQSLQQRIDRTGPLKLAEILRIGKQIAAGLAAAHAEGLIHRDVKPANILLENGVERVKITDFGLARAVDEARVTKTGVVAGTPEYMSPEQAQGLAIDYRSDLFSLGCVLYAMCTGRSPFRGESTIAVIRRVCDDTPRPVREVNPEIPGWLAEIIKKLLSKKPGERLQSAREVSELLGQHLAHLQQPAAVPRPGSLSPAADTPVQRQQRGRGRWGVAGVVALALLAVLTLTESTGFTRLWIAVTNSLGNGSKKAAAIGTPGEEPGPPPVDVPRVNRALQFNGRDHYVLTPIKIDTGDPLTVEAFVIPVSENPLNAPRMPHMTRSWSTIVSDQHNSGIGLLISPTGFWFVIHNGSDYVAARSTQFPFRGERVHLAGVFDGKWVRLFVNGHLSAETPFTGTFNPSPLTFMIGADPQPGAVNRILEFKGIMDEVRFSKVARYASDFAPEERFESDDDTLALYHFDEGKGEVAYDSSANRLDARIAGAEWIDVDSLSPALVSPPRRAPQVTSPAPKDAVDLLAITDPKRDTRSALVGACRLEDKRLILANCPTVAIPYLPPDQYEIRVRLQRLSGFTGFGISFNLDGKRLWALVDNVESKKSSSSISVWTGRQFETVAEVHPGTLLSCGQSATLCCGVVREGQNRKVYLKCDGVDICHWQGEIDKPVAGNMFSLPDNRFVSLAGFGDTFVIESAELIPISGKGQPLCFTDESAPRDYQAAERLIWHGGVLRLRAGGNQPVEINQVGNLPSSLVINGIDLRRCRRFADDQLTDVTGFGKLETVGLRGQKDLSDTALESLVTVCSPREIDLANTSITDETLGCLAGISGLESLDLSFTAITDEGLASIEGCKSLRRLALAGTQISDAGVQHLSKLTELAELDLSGTNISGDGLEKLKNLTGLERLMLDHTQIQDADMAHLRSTPTLTSLSLANTRVSDAGLRELDELKGLAETCVVGTQVTTGGVAAFNQKLPDCRVEHQGDAPVDLLKLFSIHRKADTGGWTFKQEALVSSGGKWPRVKIPFLPPEEYLLDVAAGRASRKDGGLFLGLVLGGQRFGVTINTILAGAIASGLELVDGRRVDNNETTVAGYPLGDSEAFTIRVVVRKSRITVSIDGRLIIDWHGDPSRLAPYHWQGDFDENVLALSSYDTVYRITKMQITPISSTNRNEP